MYKLAGSTAIIWFLLVVSVQGQNSFKYWVDASCRRPEDNSNQDEWQASRFNSAIGEALNMARRTSARMQEISSGTLPIPANDIPALYNDMIFNSRFQGHFTDNALVQRVRNVFDAISSYSETTVQDEAEIRFYCDDDNRGRLTLVPDIQNVDYSQIGGVPNSQRTNEREWVDTRNGIRYRDLVLGCHEDPPIPAYTLRYADPDPRYANQNQNRAVIVLCDYLAEADTATFREIVDHDFTTEINFIDTLERVNSHIILHEMLHCHPIRAEDVLVNGGPAKAYGWQVPLGLAQADAFQNVESYTYYAVATILADRGVCVATVAGQFQQGRLVRSNACRPASAPTKKRSTEKK